MASVTLDRLWLHDSANFGTYFRFYTTGRSDERSVVGDVRRYASGRLRTVVRTGQANTFPVTLVQVTDVEFAQLEAWLGKVLMVRDHRGRLFFGSYFSLEVDDYPDRSGYDVSVTLAQVTDTYSVV